MSEEENDVGLVEAVRPVVELLLQLADTAKEVASTQTLPAADSEAMMELAGEQHLPGAEVLGEPIQSGHSLMRIFAFAALDHMRNYARLFESEPVPVYSHFVLARACLDVCGVAYWLGEPGVGVPVRAQRYMALRLANAAQQHRSPIPEAKAKAAEIREGVQRGADAAGWTVENDLRSVEHQILPFPKQLFTMMLDGPLAEEFGPRIGPLLWWYLSGVTHGVQYALAQSIDPEGRDAIRSDHRAIFTASSTTCQLGWSLASAFIQMTDRHFAVFNWRSPQWDAAKHRFGALSAQLKALLGKE